MRRALLLLPLFLIGCSKGDNPYAAENAERAAYAKKTLIEGDAGDTLRVASNPEVQFGFGFSLLSSDPADEFRSKPFRWMGANAHIRLKSHGKKAMKIVIAGWVHEKMVQAHPSMDVFIDGYLVHSSAPFEKEHYWVEFVTPDWVFERPWVDMVLRLSSVGFHWDHPPELKTMVLYRFEYGEAP